MTIRLPAGVFLAVPPVPMLNPPPVAVEGVAAAPMYEGVAAREGFIPAKPEVGLGADTEFPTKPNVPEMLGTGGAPG